MGALPLPFSAAGMGDGARYEWGLSEVALSFSTLAANKSADSVEFGNDSFL